MLLDRCGPLTATEIHVTETDGSGTQPSETGLGKGKGECEKTRENSRKRSKALESASGGQCLLGEGCRTRGERPCQIHQEQVQEHRNPGHDGSETEVRVGTLVPTGTETGRQT